MSIDFGSHGFDFTRDLCDAIERFTADAVKRRPNSFLYRGMQLRYAVERRLYIQCINSETLFRRYLVQKGCEESSPTDAPLNTVESDIASFLPGARVSRVRMWQKVCYLLDEIARRAYSWFRSWYRRGRDEGRPAGPGNDILIHVGNAKFASYLSPVTGKLSSGSYAYLAACDHELGLRLRRSGHPVASRPSEGPSIRSIFSPPALSRFVQLVHEADATQAALRAFRPKCVVVVEGNAPLDVITSEACRVLGIPCFCVQQGWSPYIHSGFRNMAFTEMFVWGGRFAQLLEQHNPNQKFRVTGNHTIQTAALSSTASASGARTFSFFLQAPCALLGVAAYDAFVNLIAELAAAHLQVRFVVREHPGYPLPVALKNRFTDRPNVRLSEPSTEPLAGVVSASELAVSVFSTVLLEAVALNVVPLICSIGSIKRYEPDLVSLGAAIEVSSISEARQVIDDVIAHPERLAQLRKNLPGVVAQFFKQGEAAQMIAGRLLEVCVSTVEGARHERP